MHDDSIYFQMKKHTPTLPNHLRRSPLNCLSRVTSALYTSEQCTNFPAIC